MNFRQLRKAGSKRGAFPRRKHIIGRPVPDSCENAHTVTLCGLNEWVIFRNMYTYMYLVTISWVFFKVMNFRELKGLKVEKGREKCNLIIISKIEKRVNK